MSTDRLTQIPAAIVAGDTVAVTLSLADYPAPIWALRWAFAGPSPAFAVTSSASGSDHTLDLSSTVTESLASGLYQWSIRATDGTTTKTVMVGTVTVSPDLATVSVEDATPWEVTAIAALQASISGTAETGWSDFMIDGRRVVEIPLADRMKLLSTLEARVAAKSGDTFGVAIRYSYRPLFTTC